MVSAARMVLVSHHLQCPALAVALPGASGVRSPHEVLPRRIPFLPRVGIRLRVERRQLLSAVQNSSTGHTTLQDLEKLLQVKAAPEGVWPVHFIVGESLPFIQDWVMLVFGHQHTVLCAGAPGSSRGSVNSHCSTALAN